MYTIIFLEKYKIPSKVISLFRVRSSSLEKDIKGLKRREKFEADNFAVWYYTYLRYK